MSGSTTKKPHNPKGRYIIHSDHKKLPKERDETNYISFDPGQTNFTVRLESRTANRAKHGRYCTTIETLAQAKHTVTFQRVLLDNKKATRCLSTIELVAVLDSYIEFYDKVNIALVEGQMAINYNMMHMQSVIISYFLLKYPHIVVVEISAKLKGTNLGATNLNRTQLKKWGIEKARYLAEQRGDKFFLDYLDKQVKGKPKKDCKIDDDTDNYIQIEAFCVEVGYQLTKTAKSKAVYKGPARLVTIKSTKKVVRTLPSKVEKRDSDSDSSSYTMEDSSEST